MEVNHALEPHPVAELSFVDQVTNHFATCDRKQHKCVSSNCSSRATKFSCEARRCSKCWRALCFLNKWDYTLSGCANRICDRKGIDLHTRAYLLDYELKGVGIRTGDRYGHRSRARRNCDFEAKRKANVHKNGGKIKLHRPDIDTLMLQAIDISGPNFGTTDPALIAAEMIAAPHTDITQLEYVTFDSQLDDLLAAPLETILGDHMQEISPGRIVVDGVQIEPTVDEIIKATESCPDERLYNELLKYLSQ